MTGRGDREMHRHMNGSPPMKAARAARGSWLAVFSILIVALLSPIPAAWGADGPIKVILIGGEKSK
jgi:hypothetical protein